MSEEKGSKGCLYIGCLSIIVILTIVFLIAGYYVNKVRNLAFDFTRATPIELKQVDYTEDEEDIIQTKFDDFKNAIDKGQDCKIELSEREVNILIVSNSDADFKLDDKVRVIIEDNKLKGEISVPIPDLPGWVPFPNGRYFTGNAGLDIYASDGALSIILTSFKLGEEELPAEVIKELSKKNLADDLYKKPENRKWLSKLEKIEIKDNKLILHIKAE